MIATRRASNLLWGAVVRRRTKTLASLSITEIQLPTHILSSWSRGYHTTITRGAPFGGKKGSFYDPKGYNLELDKWNDWYGLGRMIFEEHEIKPIDGADDGVLLECLKMKDYWTKSIKDTPPTLKQIKELKEFCRRDDLTVEPSESYKTALSRRKATESETNKEGTGSPLKK